MAIYEAVDPTGVFSGGIGRDSPYGKAPGLFKPKIMGPGSGRIKLAIRGAQYFGRYFRKNPRFAARIAAVAGGYGVSRYASSNKYRKALRATKLVYGRRRRFNATNNKQCCCCTNGHGKRNQRRRYR